MRLRRKKLMFDTERCQHQLEIRLRALALDEKRAVVRLERIKNDFLKQYKDNMRRNASTAASCQKAIEGSARKRIPLIQVNHVPATIKDRKTVSNVQNATPRLPEDTGKPQLSEGSSNVDRQNQARSKYVNKHSDPDDDDVDYFNDNGHQQRSYSISPGRPRSPRSSRDVKRYSYDLKRYGRLDSIFDLPQYDVSPRRQSVLGYKRASTLSLSERRSSQRTLLAPVTAADMARCRYLRISDEYREKVEAQQDDRLDETVK